MTTPLTLQEAAAQLRLSEQTVRRYVKGGRIVATRVGPQGRYRIEPRELEKVITPST